MFEVRHDEHIQNIEPVLFGILQLTLIAELIGLYYLRTDLARGHRSYLFVVAVLGLSVLLDLATPAFYEQAQTWLGSLRLVLLIGGSLAGMSWIVQVIRRSDERLPPAEVLQQENIALKLENKRQQEVAAQSKKAFLELKETAKQRRLELEKAGQRMQGFIATLSKNNHQLARYNDLLDSLVNRSPLAIMVLDSARRVQSWNPAAERLFGWTSDEVMGKPIPTIPQQRTEEFNNIFGKTIKGIARPALNTRRLRKDGSYVDVRVWNSPLREVGDGEQLAMAIFEDIGDQRRAQEATEQARCAAESANEAKTSFLAAVTHETRTPLLGILSYAELLLNEGELNEQQRQFVEVIIKNGHYMEALIADILDSAAIESGNLSYELSAANIPSIVGEVIESMQSSAEHKGIELTCWTNPDFPKLVKTDAVRVKQIVFNLCSNAVKYSDHGNVKITVDFDKKNNAEIIAVIKVKDSGLGIAPEDTPKLFCFFSQIIGPHAKRRAGVGLGLFISKRIANDLGGELRLVDSSPRGSTFEASLPLHCYHS